MKKKNSIIATILAITMFCVIIPLGPTNKKTVNALSPDYNGQSDTIYYFNDYYPTVRPSKLEEEYPDYNIIFDRQQVTAQSFTLLVNSGYFTGFAEGCLVIIDIKTFLPDANLLNTLFYSLHETQGCKTMFMSIYNQQNYYNDYFLSYVDEYQVVGFERLESFLEAVLYIMNGRNNNTLYNTTYFIDSALVNADAFNPGQINAMCSAIPFLRILLDKFADSLSITGSYSYIAEVLNYLTNNIKIFVAISNGHRDIASWDGYAQIELGDFAVSNNVYPWNDACAIGFSSLSSSFYDFAADGYSLLDDFPIYLFEADPIEYSEDGLPVITDSDLAEVYECENDEETGALAAISSLLN